MPGGVTPVTKTRRRDGTGFLMLNLGLGKEDWIEPAPSASRRLAWYCRLSSRTGFTLRGVSIVGIELKDLIDDGDGLLVVRMLGEIDRRAP